VFGSNLGQDTGHLELRIIVVSLSPSRKPRREYLNKITTAFFAILSYSSFVSHLSIRW
jgi:hypothetical protein